MNTLSELMAASSSDKGHWHGYPRFYEPLFAPLREAPIHFVEIGVGDGHSLQVWERYFSNARAIYGVDSDVAGRSSASFGLKQAQLIQGDQGDPGFWKGFAESIGDAMLDIVIDDGSHLPSHQLTSFECLWPRVAAGGIYAIDDIETSYWDRDPALYGRPLEHEPSTVEHFKQVVDAINREFSDAAFPSLYRDIRLVTFASNLILVQKQTEEDRAYRDRPYRFPEMLAGSRS
jgi:hypothetical protein